MLRVVGTLWHSLALAGILSIRLVANENHSHPMAGDASSENGKLSTGYPQAIHLLHGSNIPYSIAMVSGACRIHSMMKTTHETENTTSSRDFTIYWVPQTVWLSGEPVSPHLRFKGIPIHLLAEFKAQYKGRGFKIRWRGPRKHRKDRHWYLRQSVCTREDAVSFSVYYYG